MAVRWYQKSADKGHVESLYHLGNCYYYGYGISKDYAKAVNCYIKAAKQGSVESKNILKDLGYSF